MSNKQVILVTGASSGIGLAIARQLASDGHQVFGTSRSPKQNHSEPFTFVQLDVTDVESVQSSIQSVIDRANHIDVLVNNAGYDLYGEAESTTFDEMFKQVDTNFFGGVRMMQAIMPIMREQKHGKIINISSIGEHIALPFNSAYSASKFALEGYTESMRYELLQYNIYTSLVIASGVRTDTLDHSIQNIADTASPYATQRQAMIAQMRELSSTSALLPQDIAKTISKIVRTKSPRLRYTVGQQATMLKSLKSLLPQWAFEQIILNQFNIKTKTNS
ncbi:MAG: SDR family NAD(P)-dependent oxidoreductase [Chloroflexota bacterium]